MNYDTTSKNTVAHSTFEHLEHHNISKIVILPHKSHVSHKYKCMNVDFWSINTRIEKISSAQNTVLCREWLLQKLTFRHSEITIFNHSQYPTQRSFGEPPAPSVYIYIYIYAHVYNRLLILISMANHIFNIIQHKPQLIQVTIPKSPRRSRAFSFCTRPGIFLSHWAIRIHWIKSGSLGIPPKIKEFSMETILSGMLGKFHPSGYYVHHLEKMRHVLSRHVFFTMSCQIFNYRPEQWLD